MKEKTIFCWSSGKDSALALYKMIQSGRYEISCLFTTITEGYDRISMHGVPRALFKEQMAQINFPYEEMFIPQESSNEEYETRMGEMLSKYLKQGIAAVAFGDIFLEDLRDYRQAKLAKIGMKAVFPLWKQDTSVLANEFIESGFKAVVTCVDAQFLDKEFCGRPFDREFLSSLPSPIDPCGEKGEFHTFVYAGPIFRERIDFVKGDIVLRDGRFYFCDIIPIDRN
jgi:uncharacterized protein (TIGR00290 family)